MSSLSEISLGQLFEIGLVSQGYFRNASSLAICFCFGKIASSP